MCDQGPGEVPTGRWGIPNAHSRRDLWTGALFLIISLAVGVEASASAWRISVPSPRAAAAILIEPTTGQVLYEMNADTPRAPASIVKTMLELVVLEKVADGELAIDDSIHVSAWASKIGGSQVYLREGEVFSLEDLMKAIVIHSANDACVAVAEHVAGSAEGFIDMMNIRAQELELTATHFINVHGLDDMPGAGNVTSARDIAAIAQHLVKMPHVLEWSSIQEEMFRGGEFKLENTNKLLGRFQGLDGLKTGYTHKAGFCLCATAERKGLRLISVILGAESNKARFDETARLLSAGFNQLTKKTLIVEGGAVSGAVPVSGGRKRQVAAVAAGDVSVILPKRAEAPVPVLVPVRGLKAPIARGDIVGSIELRLDDGEIISAPAVAATSIGRATIFDRIAQFFGGGK